MAIPKITPPWCFGTASRRYRYRTARKRSTSARASSRTGTASSVSSSVSSTRTPRQTPIRRQINRARLADWTSNAHHDAFIAAPHYQPFLQRFQTILASDPPPNPLFHVDFASSAALAACLAANVTETITLAWDAAPAGPPANFISSVHDFIATCHAAAAAGDGDGDGDGRVPGLRAHAAGTSHEELLVTGITATAMDPTTWTGTEPARWTGTAAGRVAVVVLGWDSVAAQKQFRGTAAFRGKLELLRQGAAGAQMGNTPFMRFWPDFASTSLGV